jgi:hypothetical protein
MAGEGEAAAAIDKLIARLDVATAAGVMEGALRLEALGRAAAPIGPSHGGYSPGSLRRSFRTEGPTPLGFARYVARVGPTTVYGRIRELGGHIYPVRAPMLRWRDDSGVWHAAKHVYQKPQPYLKPATMLIRRDFNRIMRRHWADAIRRV